MGRVGVVRGAAEVIKGRCWVLAFTTPTPKLGVGVVK